MKTETPSGVYGMLVSIALLVDNIDKKSESGEWHVNREFLYIPSTFLTNECSDSKSFKISSPMSPSIANKNTNPSRSVLFFATHFYLPIITLV